MQNKFVEIELAALILGLKHSADSDHILAVSRYMINAKNSEEVFKNGLNWTIGHIIGAIIISLIIFFFKDAVFSSIIEFFDLIVGIMLIFFGVLGIFYQKKINDSSKIIKVGLIQGLASNDELILLLMFLGLKNIAQMIYGIVIFSIGLFLGMIILGLIFILPSLSKQKEEIVRVLNLTISIISIVIGLMIISNN